MSQSPIPFVSALAVFVLCGCSNFKSEFKGDEDAYGDNPDEDAGDGNDSDAGTPDEGTPDEGTSDEGTPDEGTPDEGTPDEGTPDDPACERPHYGLTDLSDDFGPWTCDVQEATGVEAVGATSFFYGMYKQEDGTFKGYEEWHLFANDAWKEAGGGDCVMRWNVTGTESSPSICAGCDIALDVILTFDESCSDCPESLSETEQGSFNVRYEVLRDTDGTTRWFFGGSGNEFAQGLTNDEAMNFASDPSCRWF